MTTGSVRWSVPGLGAPGWLLGHHAIALALVGAPALLLVVTEAAAWHRRRRSNPDAVASTRWEYADA